MRPKHLLQAFAIPLLLSLGLAIACSKPASDAQVTSEVQSKIGSDSSLQGKQIAAQANNGVVTLSGTVDSDFQRTAAANDAAQVPGVKTVVNNLQVSAPAAQAQPEPAQPEEEQQPAAPRREARSQPAPRRRPSSSAAPVARNQQRPEPEYNDSASPAPPPAAAAAPAAPAPPMVHTVTVPEGSSLSVRLIDSLSSEQNQPGDTFRASLASPVVVDGQTVIPTNADVEGRVVQVQSAGHFKGQSLLTLELTRLTVNGRSYELQTNQWSKQGASRGKRTAETVGGGSALGAIIGAIAGGGKGAAIGAAVGAGAGTGVQGVTKGEQVQLPSETLLNFTLQAPLSVTPVSSRNR